MYVLKHGIKKNPEKRWALPDRIFFGHGACAILAGTFLEHPPLEGFYGERIIPGEGFSGNHIYVTNGVIAFDYHGYSSPRAAAGTPWKRLGFTQPRMALRDAPGSISICSTRSNSTGERCWVRTSTCTTRSLGLAGSFGVSDHAEAAARALRTVTR